MKLVAVDHPDSIDVFVDETLRAARPGEAAPLPRRRARAAPLRRRRARRRRAPRAARERRRLRLELRRPRAIRASSSRTISCSTSARTPVRPDSRLFLRGWIYPTDASINVALAQQKAIAPAPPSLEVRDARGQWRTVVPSLGFPSGKDKTMVIDLAGKFPTADHHVRIRTSMQIYWDQAFVARAPTARRDEAHDALAALRRPARARLLAHVPQGRPLRPVLVRLRLRDEAVALAADHRRASRATATCCRCSARPTTVHRHGARRRGDDPVRRELGQRAAHGLAARLPALHRRLDQGLRSQHGVRHDGRAAPLPRRALVPVRAGRRVSDRLRAPALSCASTTRASSRGASRAARLGRHASEPCRTDPGPPSGAPSWPIPFVAALLIAARLNSGPIRSGADATHPGFALRDETAEAGIRFVHHRPTLRSEDRRHRAARRRRSAPPSPSPTSTATASPTSTSPTAASASRTRSTTTAATAPSRTSARARASPTSIGPARASRWAPSGATSTTTGARICSSIATAISSLFRNVDGRHFEDITEQRRPASLGQQQRRHLARLRPRRPARPLRHRVLPRHRSLAPARRRGSCTTASSTPTTAERICSSTTWAAASSRTSPTGWASAARAGRSPPRRPTSTATAGPTSTSPTTTGRKSSTSTTTAAASS